VQDKGLEVIRQPLARPPVLGYADLIPATASPERNVYGFPVEPPPVNVLEQAAEAAAAARRRQHEAGLAQQRRVGTPKAEASGGGGQGRRGRGAFRFSTEEPEKEGAAASASQAAEASRVAQMQPEPDETVAVATDAPESTVSPWFAKIGAWTDESAAANPDATALESSPSAASVFVAFAPYPHYNRCNFSKLPLFSCNSTRNTEGFFGRAGWRDS
jgi:hypothetical protein